MPELHALLHKERARAEAERARAEAERATSKQRIAALEKERDNLRSSHERLRHELELFKRRLFIAKAERSNDAGQLELEFAAKLRELDALAGTLGIANDRPESDDTPARDGKPRGKRTNNRGTGRRDLKELGLEQERIEIPDPRLEALVAQGKVERHGFEETLKLMNRRATKVLLVVARVRYKTVDAEGNTDVITTAMPNEMLPGSMAAPSFASNIIMENVGKGMPLFRLEESFTRDGICVDRGSMARWKKLVGDGLASTVVKAM